MEAYSCANRAADPTNEYAACRQWCGNSQTCLQADGDETLVQAMVRFYGAASPEMQAYLRGEGPQPQERNNDCK